MAGPRRGPEVSEDDEIVDAFLEESRENLEQLDHDLVDLESRPGDPDLLARVFRTIHTIKGTCGFLGYQRLEALTHMGENLLGAIRAGQLGLDAPTTTSLLCLVDAVRAVLGRIEETGAEGDDDYASLISQLGSHLDPIGPGPASPAAAPPPGPAPAAPAPAQPPEALPAPPASIPSPEAPARPGAPSATPESDPEATGLGGMAGESSVRVDVAVLDKLLDLVGELVLARSQIGEVALAQEDGPLAAPYRQLRLVTSELQEGVMRARLQPVGTVISKFRRIARDLATALDKKVRVELEGEDVGVDKAVNEALRDPLLHLVRNAMDHGLESPAARLEAGKAEEGRLRLRVYHEGGRVQVEVSDDGRGVDVDRLVLSAVGAGMLSPDEAATLSRTEALQLMFRPGLSTKDEITTMSGRGVGMDVVRANLEGVGGSIDVSSDPGQGSMFRINVPLTLAIMPAVVAWSGGGRYAIPQVDVREVLRLEGGERTQSVDDVGSARFHRLRGRLLPLVGLAQCLQVVAAPVDAALVVVVVETQGIRFGLIVDAVGNTTEAVVKPLTHATRSIPVFAGVTIMGDGRPSLILDIAGLASCAGVQSRVTEDTTLSQAVAVPSDQASILLASGADGGRLAVRLADVRRLEQFGVDRIERTGAGECVQYDDGILPLLRVSTLLDGGAGTDSPGVPSRFDTIQAVVCDTSSGLIGLIVDHIDDIVAEPSLPRQKANRPGVSGCLIAEERVTEVLDVEALVALAGAGNPS